VLAALLVTAWIAPVPGHVTRGFDLGANPFAPGRHRGADFAARPGTPVRAACAGRVVVAGRVGTSGRVVTVRCGPYRVTAMPLAAVATHRGDRVRAGARIGTAARSPDHAGIHLGVRRAGERFAYVDPLRLLGGPSTKAPPVGPAGRPGAKAPPVGPAGRPGAKAPPVGPAGRAGAEAPPVGPATRPVGRGAPVAPRAEPAGTVVPSSNPVAPWPAWAGLGLALAGAVGAAAIRLPRIRRGPLPRASPDRVR
jgi:hypothetical protein